MTVKSIMVFKENFDYSSSGFVVIPGCARYNHAYFTGVYNVVML